MSAPSEAGVVQRGETLARRVCAGAGMLLTEEAVTLLQIGVRAGVLAAQEALPDEPVTPT